MSTNTLASATKANPKPLYKRIWDNASILIIYLVMFVILSLTVPYFFSWENMVGLSLAISTVGVVACTMLFCLAAGDFDLSVGSVVAMSGVLAAAVVNRTGSVTLGIAAGIFGGGVVGLVNGSVIAALGINALITTLATMQIVRGLAFIGPDSDTALRAVLAAGRQGRLWDVVELLYGNQGAENSGWVSEELLGQIAAEVPGLDPEQFAADRQLQELDSEIAEAQAQATLAGVHGTPSFELGRTGGHLEPLEVTSLAPDQFRTAIDALLG